MFFNKFYTFVENKMAICIFASLWTTDTEKTTIKTTLILSSNSILEISNVDM